jgi:mediator of RNA polymerase II transcription subunit 7
MDDADAAIAAEQQEVKNPFPTPPIYWTRYTPENLRLLALLKDKIAENRDDTMLKESKDAQMTPNEAPDHENKLEQDVPVDQAEILPEGSLLPSFPLLELEPPRLDWILEQKHYSTFGEDHPVSTF